MRRIRWPVAVAAALLLFSGGIVAAREHLNIAGALIALGAALIGAWLVIESKGDD